MDCIAKITWREGEIEILAANNFELLGRMVGQALERDFALDTVAVEFTIRLFSKDEPK